MIIKILEFRNMQRIEGETIYDIFFARQSDLAINWVRGFFDVNKLISVGKEGRKRFFEAFNLAQNK